MKKIFLGKKISEYYNGLLIKADLGLHKQISDTLLKEVNPCGKVLDLGAGEGALSERLSDLGFEVTSADKDSENFKCKRASFHQVNFDNADEIDHFVKRNEGSFDAVCGIEVIEHVQDQWMYVQQLIKMLKPGGLILISTPNTTSWISRLIFFFTGRFHQFSDSDLTYGHISPISSWELNLILHESGARDINISAAGTLPPIYITGLNKLTFLNLVILPLRFFMSGIIDGWCIIATARKPK